MTKLTHFFDLIRDGSWHPVNKLSKTLKVPANQLTEMVKLLTEQNLIEYKQETNKIKINPKWKIICEQYDEPAEQKEAVATVIIPQEKTLTFQNTKITNLTDKPLELNLRINKELKEITIDTAE